jgi:methionyl-tRNA synthetase
VHGYLTVNGQKISKSLGNVVDPLAQVEKYGTDAVRYYLLRGVSPVEDGDYSEKRVRELYNADLANNLGNLVRRIETLGEKAGYVLQSDHAEPEAPDGFHDAFQEYRFHDAVTALWSMATALNQYVDQTKPWELQKQGRHQEIKDFLHEAVNQLRRFGYWLEPFLPETSHMIQTRFTEGKPLKQGEPLFPRLK